MVSHGFFEKGEIAEIGARHLGVDGELRTRELAYRVMVERKLDASDTTPRISVVFEVVEAPRHARRRELVRMAEERRRTCASGWRVRPPRCTWSPTPLPSSG